MTETQQRATAILKLFVGFGAEPSAEQIAIWVEATERASLEHLRRAVDYTLNTRGDEQPFPRPGDLNAICRRYREAERGHQAVLERRAERRLASGMVSLGAALSAIELPESTEKR